ncbi:MAG: TatD family hydrolase [Patescibacteria group bacterium]
MIIDTHVHYNLETLFNSNDWSEHWETAQKNGITKSIVVGTDFLSSTVATQIASKTEGLFASVGCHPTIYHESFQDAEQHKVASFDSLFEDMETDIEELNLILDDKKVVAIGETGLDYFRLPADGEERSVVIDIQKKAFEKHVELAQKKDLPLILHVRDKAISEEKIANNAYWDALEVMQKHNISKFTLHCVSGPISYVKVAIEMGGYMGFDGNITYPKAQQIRDIFAIVPMNKRLVETDAPFLPPQEFRGKTCEPWMLAKTVEYIESELKVDRTSFAENAERLFKI